MRALDAGPGDNVVATQPFPMLLLLTYRITAPTRERKTPGEILHPHYHPSFALLFPFSPGIHAAHSSVEIR
jgi:hypothetical protein